MKIVNKNRKVTFKLKF